MSSSMGFLLRRGWRGRDQSRYTCAGRPRRVKGAGGLPDTLRGPGHSEGKTRAKSMARGILSGVIWGTVLSVGGLAAVSVLVPGRPGIEPATPVRITEDRQPGTEYTASLAPEGQSAPEAEETREPEPEAEQSPAAEERAAPGMDEDRPTPEQAEGTDSSAVEIAAQEVDTPEVDATDADATEADRADDTATDNTAVVDTAAEVDATEDTATEDTAAEAVVTDDSRPETVPARRPSDVTAVTPEGDTPDLQTPDEAEDDAPEETVAAPVPAPATGDAIAALDAPVDADAPDAPASSGGDTAPQVAFAPELNAPESETGLNISTEPAQPPVPTVPQVNSALEPAAPAPDAGEEAPEARDNETAEADRPQVRRLVPDTPDSTVDQQEEDSAALSRPIIGTPAASLTDRNPGNSARLPSIGGGADAADPSPEDMTADDDSRPPLQRFAAEIDSDPSLPRMAIGLIDDGKGPLGPDALDGFPFPVTFAIDPGQPDAAERMSAYRAAGYEVATLVDLPQAAQPTDVEQILAGAVAAVPEAVALIEAPGGGLQSGRDTTQQATSFAAESGHGLVFLPNGLNTAQAIAERENVASASILRDFDGESQDARTKRRFLDGAAFRARQDGSVVMLGRLTPDTLSALLLWSLQDRAASVAMVPVSTILLDADD